MDGETAAAKVHRAPIDVVDQAVLDHVVQAAQVDCRAVGIGENAVAQRATGGLGAAIRVKGGWIGIPCFTEHAFGVTRIEKLAVLDGHLRALIGLEGGAKEMQSPQVDIIAFLSLHIYLN